MDDTLTEAEKEQRLAHRIFNHGKVCIDCGETLTLKERKEKWCYCFRCWPLERRLEDIDGQGQR